MENNQEKEPPQAVFCREKKPPFASKPAHPAQKRESVNFCLDLPHQAFVYFVFTRNFGGGVCESESQRLTYIYQFHKHVISWIFKNNELVSIELIGKKYLISKQFIIHHWRIIFNDLESLLVRLLGYLRIASEATYSYVLIFILSFPIMVRWLQSQAYLPYSHLEGSQQCHYRWPCAQTILKKHHLCD